MNRTIAVLSIVFLFGCAAPSHATECGTPESVRILEPEPGPLGEPERTAFCIALTGGTEIENVIYYKQRITEDWVLQFRGIDGMKIRHPRIMGQGASKDQLTVDEYSELLERTLTFLLRELKVKVVDQIQVDVLLVDETWQSVVETVRRQAAQLSGRVMPKVRVVDMAVLRTIRASEQVRQTCRILGTFDLQCNEHLAGMNPISYEDSAYRLEWGALAQVEDAGIYKRIWFGVGVEPKEVSGERGSAGTGDGSGRSQQ